MSHIRKTTIGLRTAALLVVAVALASGCTLLGRPQSFHELGDQVVDAFSHDRVDLLEDMVITNEDRRRIGEEANGDPRQPDPQVLEAVRKSYFDIRKAGAEAGIIWSDARMSSADYAGAKYKYKEKVNVTVNIDSHGNRYSLRINNAQIVDDGDIVLTDVLQWLGEK